MFELLADKKAFLSKVEGLPKGVKRKLLMILKVLKVNPVPARNLDVKKLEGFENTYRIRIGKYRIIYKVLWNEMKIFLLKLCTRSKAYKK